MTNIVPAGYTVRQPTPADVDAILALMTACDVAEAGEPDNWTAEDVMGDWADKNTWLLLAADGQVAGYAEVHTRGLGRIGEDVYVHPAHRGRGLGTFITRTVEQRAAELLAEHPGDLQVLLDTGINAGNQAARNLLVAEDYVPIRHFWQMAITLETPPPTGSWPEGIRVRTCVPGQDERMIFDALEEAFLDHWGHTPQRYEEWVTMNVDRTSYDPTLWWLALSESGEPAGAIRCRVRPDGGWVNTLGVRRPWRGKGLGKALLLQAFGELYRRRIAHVALGVDAQNPTGATYLYESVGMRAAKSYTVFQKTLREGAEAVA